MKSNEVKALSAKIDALKRELDETKKAIESVQSMQQENRIAKIRTGIEQVALSLLCENADERLGSLRTCRTLLAEGQQEVLFSLNASLRECPEIKDKLYLRIVDEVFHPGICKRANQCFLEAQEFYELYVNSTMVIAYTYACVGENEVARRFVDSAKNRLEEIDTKKIKTIQAIHSNVDFSGAFFLEPGNYLQEKQLKFQDVLEAAK